MGLSRRSFIKRLLGGAAAVGIGAKALPEVTQDPITKLDALEGFSQTLPLHTFDVNDGDMLLTSVSGYKPGLIYYHYDGTWRLATHEDFDGVIGIAVDENAILTQGEFKGFSF